MEGVEGGVTEKPEKQSAPLECPPHWPLLPPPSLSLLPPRPKGGEVGEGGAGLANASVTHAKASKSAEVLQVAGEGDLARMRELFMEDESVISCEDYDRRAPLHLAASEGREEMVKWLLLKASGEAGVGACVCVWGGGGGGLGSRTE